jgi:hypothetical protein
MRFGNGTTPAAAAGLLALASAAVATVPEISFKVGAVALKVQQPMGFCPPSASEAPLATANADADPHNLTLATLLACNRAPEVRPWSNYVLIKTPTMLVNGSYEKAATLDQMATVFAGPNSPKFDDKMTDEIGTNTERAIGVRIEITGKYGYAGRDADCVYLAGPMQAQVAGRTVKGLIATCITVAGGKMIGINLYQIAETPDLAAIKTMKAQVRAIGLSIHR